MRIVFTSDLHADLEPSNAALIAPLARAARALTPDIFVVAGDVAERTARVAEVLAAFCDVGARRVFVPGNHDLYVEPGGGTSRAKLDTELPAAAAAAGFECPHVAPITHRGWAIVASPGHWDYSLRDPSLDAVVSLGHYRAGAWRSLRAWDRGSILWPRGDGAPVLPTSGALGAQPASLAGSWATDEEICAALQARLEAQLDALPGARVLAVVHTLPFAGIFPRRAFGPASFYDAFLGSTRVGESLLRHGGVRAVVTGHLHRALDAQVEGVGIVSRPVGRRREPPADLDALARECLGTIDLD